VNRVSVSAEDVPLPDWSAALEGFSGRVLEWLGRDGWELSVLICGDRTIAGLNSAYRGKDGSTDVLSFSQDEGFPFPPGEQTGEGRRHAGDIAISLDTLRENARLFEVDEDEELRRLLIHGILHLDGMDHHTNDKAEPMLRLQEQILEELSDLRILPTGGLPAGLPTGGIA